jgi:hypothetical protein
MEHAKQYTARSGRIQYKPSADYLEHLISNDSGQGFCLACAEQVDGIEPDAGQETCPHCGEDKAYGAEELYTHGLYFDADREADITEARRAGYTK